MVKISRKDINVASHISVAKGYACLIVMPDDQAKEKSELLRQFGAHVELVKPASIVNAKHYVNQARRRASQIEGSAIVSEVDHGTIMSIHH